MALGGVGEPVAALSVQRVRLGVRLAVPLRWTPRLPIVSISLRVSLQPLSFRVVMNGARGHVGPVISTRDGNAASERPHVPVDEGRDLSAIGHPHPGLLAMILRSFG